MNTPMNEAQPSEAYRAKVLALTLPAVRRRARRKHALMLCAVACAYALGVVSADRIFAPTTPSPAVALSTPQAPVKGEARPSEHATLATHSTSSERHREALRAAGNRWLDVYGDIARATRIYGRYLDASPPDELSRFDPKDTWLLRTLRCARLQENVHENASI